MRLGATTGIDTKFFAGLKEPVTNSRGKRVVEVAQNW